MNERRKDVIIGAGGLDEYGPSAIFFARGFNEHQLEVRLSAEISPGDGVYLKTVSDDDVLLGIFLGEGTEYSVALDMLVKVIQSLGGVPILVIEPSDRSGEKRDLGDKADITTMELS